MNFGTKNIIKEKCLKIRVDSRIGLDSLIILRIVLTRLFFCQIQLIIMKLLIIQNLEFLCHWINKVFIFV
jgi:hypothetical protein